MKLWGFMVFIGGLLWVFSCPSDGSQPVNLWGFGAGWALMIAGGVLGIYESDREFTGDGNF